MIKHDLRAIGKIAKLRFPHDQSIGLGQAVTIFKAQDRIFGKHRIDDLILALSFTDIVERVIALLGILIDQARMAVAKGAACTILPGEPHWMALCQQGAKGQSLACGPINPFAAAQRFGFGIQHTLHGFMDWKAFGHLTKSAGHVVKSLFGHGCGAALVFFTVAIHFRPAPIEPIGLIGLIVLTRFKFRIQK